MDRPIDIRHYMLTKPITVGPDDTVLEASKKIVANKISGVCVVDQDDNLLGVLSELDCLRAIVEKVLERGEANAGLVSQAMTASVEVNHPHDQITNVASSMLDHKHRRRPVVVNGKLVGQVTCREILRAHKNFVSPEVPGERN